MTHEAAMFTVIGTLVFGLVDAPENRDDDAEDIAEEEKSAREISAEEPERWDGMS